MCARSNDFADGGTRESGARAWLPAAAALLVLAIAAVYSVSIDAPFVFDDRPAIVENPTIRQLWGSWNPPDNGSSVVSRPLVNVSFALNYAAGGMSVRGYHLFNVSLHAATALLLWGVLRRTLRRAGTARYEALAFASAALWALHPLLTESVTCIVQRTELFGGFFIVLALYGFIRSVEPGAAPRRWRLLAVAACGVGVTGKEIVAMAPLLLFVYDRCFVAGSFRSAWDLRRIFWCALAATWIPLAVLVWAGGERTGTVGFGLGIGTWEYLLTQARALALYLKLAFWPDPLVVDYGIPVVREWTQVIGRSLLVVALLATTLWAIRRRPRVGFLGAWFFLLLAPSSSVLPLTTQTIAEHRMYLPLAAIVAGAVLLLDTWARRWSIPIAVLLALAASVVTVRRNHTYRDEFRLWRQTIAALPENPRAHSSLANAHARRGEWKAAIESYREAVRLRPDFADAQNNLALALLESGEREAALPHLAAAARLKPDDPDIRFNFGNALLLSSRPAAAIEQLELALGLRSDFPAARQKLGAAWLESGEPQRAAAAFSAAVAVRPDDVQALAGWADALWALGEGEPAIQKYREALELAPEAANLHYNHANILLGTGRVAGAIAGYAKALDLSPEFAAAHHNLGLALLRVPRVAEAISHFETAVRLLPDSAPAHANLGRALAAAGKRIEALREARRALELDPQDQSVSALVAQLERELGRPGG